jgi:hypothetical protein
MVTFIVFSYSAGIWATVAGALPSIFCRYSL